MKKFVLGTLAALVAVSPIALSAAEAAPGQQRTKVTVRQKANGRTVVRQRTTVRPQANHQWRKGQRFDRSQARNYRQIDYRQYRSRHLYAPPRGYQWVQSGNDAVLVAVTGGLIGAVLAGAFN